MVLSSRCFSVCNLIRKKRKKKNKSSYTVEDKIYVVVSVHNLMKTCHFERVTYVIDRYKEMVIDRYKEMVIDRYKEMRRGDDGMLAVSRCRK